jgi:hypothetical protein
MKERPILFSAPMVRAILDGRKTMTRRVITKLNGTSKWLVDNSLLDTQAMLNSRADKGVDNCDLWHLSPYGVPSDRLWVRETFLHYGLGSELGGRQIYYKCDADLPCELYDITKWKPSIFMPRWASRITLEITDIRVERLQDISNEDAWAEGVTMEQAELYFYDGPQPVGGFSVLWDTINSKTHPWNSNPWVWVISFRVTK